MTQAMNQTPAPSGRLKLLLVGAVFAVPLIVAAFMYYGDQNLAPTGRTNAGELLEPFVNLNERRAGFSEELTERRWALIYLDRAACGESCRDALYRMRQSRLMLGNDMTRMARIFLHGDIAPDRVFLDREHAGLTTISDDGLSELLDQKRPDGLQPGGLFLVDPLGNLVMYFAADLEPDDMVGDIEHLLELSRIG